MATIAVAHSILVAAYHILDELVPYQDLGGDWFVRRQSLDHHAQRLVRQLFLLAYEVRLEGPQAPEEEAAA